MKRQIELTCGICEKKFTAEADYITPGINGFVTMKCGTQVRFIDPTAKHYCKECVDKHLQQITETTILVPADGSDDA